VTASSAEAIERALAAAQRFCAARSPDDLSDQLRVGCSRRGNSITIFEARPPWRPELGSNAWTEQRVAQLRYDATTARWSLYCCDSNSRWWPYEEIAVSASVDSLLAEVDHDPTGIFWG
jgi:hypothetical protein